MRESSVKASGVSSLRQHTIRLFGLGVIVLLLSSCSLWGWGENYEGDLGLGETREYSQPDPVRVGEGFGQLSLAPAYACGIDNNQHLYCWGGREDVLASAAEDGALGLGDTRSRQVPTRVGNDLWLEVDTNSDGDTCGLKVDGTLWCWGNGVFEPAPMGGAVWRSVQFVGYSSMCGIQADSSLWCWGEPFNAAGEKIGDGWQTLVGGTHPEGTDGGFCGLRDDGFRWCNDPGEGDPATPIQADSYQWKDAAGPRGDDCGIQEDGSLWCGIYRHRFGSWQSVGGNIVGLCGVQVNGTLWCFGDYDNLPVQVGDETDWVDVFVGRLYLGARYQTRYQCATKTDGSLWCWGSDSFDQLGDPGPEDRPDPTPISAIDWAQIAAGSGATCGIDTSDGLWCWGTGQPIGTGAAFVGFGTATEPTKIQDERWVDEKRWVDVDVTVGDNNAFAAGLYRHACGIQADASLWCWGTEVSGVLGVPEPIEEPWLPNRVAGTDWAQVSTGANHTCAVKTDGSLWCWGTNAAGQLGIGEGADIEWEPVQVGDASWKQVSAGGSFTCGLQADDSLWCWGLNFYDALLGDPALDYRTYVPSRIGSASWESVSAGALHTCGLQPDSSLWCWGYADSGEIGNGALGEAKVPTRVGSAAWSVVDAGDGHTCGIQDGGTLWCWGDGFYGQLGLGDFGSASTPQQVGTETDWYAVSAGGRRTMALRGN